MTWIKNKSTFSLILSLTVTAFVTACVKNDSKDTPPPVQKNLQLEASSLSSDEVNGNREVQINETLNGAVSSMVKKYSFTTTEIMNFGVIRGRHNNRDCTANGTFEHKYFIVDEEGHKSELDSSPIRKNFLPGKYNLQVEIENGSLCQNIRLEFRLKARERTDLVLTEDVDISYECRNIRENSVNLTQTKVVVQSIPLRVTKSSNLGIDDIISANRLCSNELPESTICHVDTATAQKKEGPVVAKSAICNSKDDRRRKGRAYLQMNRKSGNATAAMSCNHRGLNITLNMSRCSVLSRFGSPMPISYFRTEMDIKRGEISVKYEIDDSEKLARYGKEIFVMIYRRNERGYQRPLLDKNHKISAEEFENGEFTILERGILRRIARSEMDSLKMVFSRNPFDLSNDWAVKRGFHHIGFSKVCEATRNGIQIERPSGDIENLCE